MNVCHAFVPSICQLWGSSLTIRWRDTTLLLRTTNVTTDENECLLIVSFHISFWQDIFYGDTSLQFFRLNFIWLLLQNKSNINTCLGINCKHIFISHIVLDLRKINIASSLRCSTNNLSVETRPKLTVSIR